VSKQAYPAKSQLGIDRKVEEAFHGTTLAEEADAKELCDWMRSEFGLEVEQAKLVGVTKGAARDILWNAFDARSRPEMRGMERSLLLNRLDTAWKNHLYTMDHLRSGIGLRGYGQDDPKIAYKREGMKEFDAMWKGVEDKVTEAVFRMEEEESFQESLWTIGQ